MLPGSSWWLSDTWHKREHHLSYRRVVNSSEFDDSAECWIESPASNYKQTKSWTEKWSGLYLVSLSVLDLLPDGKSSCTWDRGGWGGEAAVPMEILYGPTPGRVDGRDLTSGLWLLTIKPEHTNNGFNVCKAKALQTLALEFQQHPVSV